MTAKLDFRAALLAGAMIVAMSGAASAGCAYHSVSAETKAPLQSAKVESEAAVDEAEAQVEPAKAVEESAPRLVQADMTPQPKQ